MRDGMTTLAESLWWCCFTGANPPLAFIPPSHGRQVQWWWWWWWWFLWWWWWWSFPWPAAPPTFPSSTPLQDIGSAWLEGGRYDIIMIVTIITLINGKNNTSWSHWYSDRAEWHKLSGIRALHGLATASPHKDCQHLVREPLYGCGAICILLHIQVQWWWWLLWWQMVAMMMTKLIWGWDVSKTSVWAEPWARRCSSDGENATWWNF